MRLPIKLFAAAKQLAGTDCLEVEVPDGATVAQVRTALLIACPALQPMLGHVKFAVDNEYVSDSATIGSGTEIACIPPVSGG